MKQCSIDWCDRPVKGLGLCAGHHQRKRNGVDMNKPWRTGSGKQCAASPTCQRTGKPGNRGMCYRHYKADQERRQREGDWSGYMPADIVNEHIAKLTAAGMSLQRIGNICGLSAVGMRLLRTRTRVWRTNGEKILAITPEGFYDSETSGFVPAVGSVRRIQALIAIGHTQVSLAERIGLTDTWLYQLLNGRLTQVCMTTARGIDTLFRELQLEIPAPSPAATAARNRAKHKGWLPPLAWDEDTIDDPDAKPYTPSKRKATDFLDEYEEMRELGWSRTKIANHLGIKPESLKDRVRRLRKTKAA